MQEILIFGGTQYVGRQLISLLHEKKYNITIASRGNFTPPLGENVKRVNLDRYDAKTFPPEINKEWDIVVDHLAFYPEEVKILTDFFGKKAKHYVLISTSAVYDENDNCTEDKFDPTTLNFNLPVTKEKRQVVPDTAQYKEGKREAEAMLAQNVASYCIVRFPKILGMDDLSNRLLEVILLGQKMKSISVSSKNKKYSFIHSKDAARFLSFVIENKIQGVINAASTGIETASSLLKKLNIDPQLIQEDPNRELSLFKGEEIVLNTDKAQKLGFKFESNQEWMPLTAGLWRHYIHYIKGHL